MEPGSSASSSILRDELALSKGSTDRSWYTGARVRRSTGPRRDIKRHRVFPKAVGENPLVAAVGVHDEDLAVGLERVVVEGGLLAEAVHAAVPHDLAVRRPDGVTVIGPVGGEPHKVVAVGANGVDVEIDRIDLAREHDAAAVRRPARQVVVVRGQDARGAILEIENAQPDDVPAPDPVDGLFAVC